MEAMYSTAEDIKVRLLSMIENAENPFEIIIQDGRIISLF